MYYRTLVPADLSDFQAFADAWYQGPPSINGAWQEREHTRQYDTTNHWELNFWTYAGTDPNQLDGEVYNTATAARIQAKIDTLLTLYFPNGDPFQRQQNEPSVAFSSRNSLHLLAGANDYRAVDVPGLPGGRETGDSWLSYFWSTNGGGSWKSTLIPVK